MSEFMIVDKNIPEYVWIYDNRQGSEYVSYNITLAQGLSTS